ncbi:MAG TPA: peptidylprolyl isomerase [Chromatiaceae bacterium]|jgi:peptidyl-prolyl cis-trans isomerase B (cyclophilin B)|nr:peptidylprolyl isomerase [Chromatiaceae bacterium]HIN82022.1 peptidylprolyl isomerase [Chromatiales bacterium]HIA08458.1 peptidylprolyl isomerase [Chromatiaceae bacterium]HIB84216.1 peptidylprolyl isomerase [Chromatiaceae bacterium]HIO14983.1 peptidylprolyl isomerase [Chromatiales bacterium]
MVTMNTSFGVIKIELYADKAPKTVANFLEYARDGFYDATIFHRVISNFMIQGGGFNPGLEHKDTHAAIENEASNGLSNEIGTLAMARTSDPHSATAQFFINVSDNKFLDFTAETAQGWGYCVFAKVTEGMDVVEKIKAVPTGNSHGHGDVPTSDVIIESIVVDD